MYVLVKLEGGRYNNINIVMKIYGQSGSPSQLLFHNNGVMAVRIRYLFRKERETCFLEFSRSSESNIRHVLEILVQGI